MCYTEMTFVFYLFIFMFTSVSAAKFNNCTNTSVSCSSQFINSDAPDSACMVEAISKDECMHWILSGGSPSSSLGAITLKTYPYEIPGYRFSIFNVTFRGIKWTSLRFRYRQHGYENKHFCRQITVTAKLSVPELFYDCHWTRSEYEGTPFTFEYRAEDLHRIEYRQYEIMLPFYKYTGNIMLLDMDVEKLHN